jgi:hypothetical protein
MGLLEPIGAMLLAPSCARPLKPILRGSRTLAASDVVGTDFIPMDLARVAHVFRPIPQVASHRPSLNGSSDAAFGSLRRLGARYRRSWAASAGPSMPYCGGRVGCCALLRWFAPRKHPIGSFPRDKVKRLHAPRSIRCRGFTTTTGTASLHLAIALFSANSAAQ